MNRIQEFTRISGEIDKLYHEAAFSLGQSDSAMTVLYVLIAQDGRCSIADICRISGMKKQTVNSALRALERDELVVVDVKSHKSRFVALSEKGMKVANKTARRLMEAEDKALESWTDQEICTYLELSAKYCHDFGEQVILIKKEAGKDND